MHFAITPNKKKPGHKVLTLNLIFFVFVIKFQIANVFKMTDAFNEMFARACFFFFSARNCFVRNFVGIGKNF